MVNSRVQTDFIQKDEVLNEMIVKRRRERKKERKKKKPYPSLDFQVLSRKETHRKQSQDFFQPGEEKRGKEVKEWR